MAPGTIGSVSTIHTASSASAAAQTGAMTRGLTAPPAAPAAQPGPAAAPGVARLAMRPPEAALFRARFDPAPGCHLEWGLGGSTAEAPWPVLAAAGAWPGRVLVGGRFRVACCLALAREALDRPRRLAPRLLVHDVNAARPHCAPIGIAWRQVAHAGTLRLHRLRWRIDAAAMAAALAAHAHDPR